MAVKPTTKPPAKGKNGFVKRDSKTGQFMTGKSDDRGSRSSSVKPGLDSLIESLPNSPKSSTYAAGKNYRLGVGMNKIDVTDFREKREMTMAGSVLGAVAIGVFTPYVPLIIAGAVLGGVVGATRRLRGEKKEPTE